MNELVQRLMVWQVRHVVARFFVQITIAAMIITAAAAAWIGATWNMNSDLGALLPESSPTAKAMQAVSDRVGSASSLFVVVDSPDREANLKFAAAYSEKLRGLPGVALAHYHNDKTFFDKHKLLYMSAEDLEVLHDRIKKTIRQRKKEANPLFVSLGPPKKSATLEVKDLQSKYSSQIEANNYREYLFSEDGYALLIIVRFTESSSDMASTNDLINKVRASVDELAPKSYHEEMKVEFGGALANRQRQYNSIVDDIKNSALFTIIGLFGLLAFYFRRPRAIIVVLTPLVMGVAWTLAVAFALYGELNAITIFIFAILLGLGIDFSIHMLHGFDRARAEGMEPVDALVECARTTGLATGVGAVTTFATFIVLSFAEFKSLSEFGVVASMGIVFTMICTITVMPSLTLTFNKLKPLPLARHKPPSENGLIERVMPKLAPLLLVVGVGATVVAVPTAQEIDFQEHFYRIGKFKWPWEKPSNDARRDEILYDRTRATDIANSVIRQAEAVRERVDPGTYVPVRRQKSVGEKYSSALQNRSSSSPTVLLFDDVEAASGLARSTAIRMRTSDVRTISSISSIHDFMPGTAEEQAERLVQIRKIKELVDGESLSFLKDKERERIEALRAQLDVDAITIYDLPAWTKRFFKEAGPRAHEPAPGEEFAFEYVMIATPRFSELAGRAARQYLVDLEEMVGTPGEGGFQLAGQAKVYTSMLDGIKADGARMISIALVVVLILLSLAFRHPGRALVAMIPLAVGSVWMLAMCVVLEIEFDFFNVIILPALIGIGVDDGVHFYMRYRELGRGSVGVVVRDVGSAVLMTSLTSLIGFGGLAITSYRGLQSIGQLAIVGIASALLATLVVLPAVLLVYERVTKEPVEAS